MSGHYESSVWRIVPPPMRVRIDLARVLPFLTPEAARPPTAAIIRSTGLRVEPTTTGELHAWIRTNRGLWVAKCSVAATIGQSHTVQLEVYAPEGTIQPAPETPAQSSQTSPQGKPGTQLAVSSGGERVLLRLRHDRTRNTPMLPRRAGRPYRSRRASALRPQRRGARNQPRLWSNIISIPGSITRGSPRVT